MDWPFERKAKRKKGMWIKTASTWSFSEVSLPPLVHHCWIIEPFKLVIMRLCWIIMSLNQEPHNVNSSCCHCCYNQHFLILASSDSGSRYMRNPMQHTPGGSDARVSEYGLNCSFRHVPQGSFKQSQDSLDKSLLQDLPFTGLWYLE